MRLSTLTCLWGTLGFCLLINTGCTRYQYDLEMVVDDRGQLKRTLTVIGTATEDGAMQPTKLADEDKLALEKIYAAPAEVVNDSDVRFTGTFQGDLPQDIGGAGRVFRWETSLGSVVTYRERFRGSYDLQGMIESRQQAARRLCELLGAWARQEARDPVVGEEIQKFINTTVMSDLQTVTLMLVLFESEEGPGIQLLSSPAGLARLVQYLIESGYLTDELVPAISRSQNDPGESLSLALRMLDLKRSGSDLKPLRESLPSLRNVTTFKESLNRFLVNTPEYAQLEEQREPTQVLGDLYLTMLGNPLRESDRLEIGISSAEPPFQTNGTWDEEENRITWTTSLEIPGKPALQMLPTFCYARWAFPHEDIQRARFGRVIFTGELLAEYVDWRMSLTETEGAEWYRFLEGVTPSTPVMPQVLSFRFQDAETPQNLKESLVGKAVELFQQADRQQELK